MTRCPGCCARCSEVRDQFAELAPGGEKACGIRKPLHGTAGELGGIGVGLDELRHDHGIGQQVGHGQVLHRDHAASDLIGQPGCAVEGKGRDAKPGALERHGSGRGEREGGLLERFGQPADFGFRIPIATSPQGSGEVNESCVGKDEPGTDVGTGGRGADPASGLEEDGEVTLEFSYPASGKQQDLAGQGWRGFGGSTRVALDDRMTHELHLKVRGIARVPILLEGEDGEQQVVGGFHAPGPPRSRRPHLRRDVLDDARIPVGSPRPLAQCCGEPQVEAAVVDAHDDVRAFGDTLVKELVEEASEGPVAADDFPESDDRMGGEIDGKLDSCRCHRGATSTGEAEA